MANTLYPKFKEGLLQGSYNLLTQTVKCMMIKTGYTYSDAHQFISDISAYDNGRSNALTNKTVTNGVFNADNTQITALSAVQVVAFVLYIDTGSDTTSPLIAYIDTVASGLPFTPAANGIVIVSWDTGINKIFRL